MKCAKCGAESEVGEVFCGECGGLLPLTPTSTAERAGGSPCPNCGSVVAPGETTCGECGQAMLPAVPRAQARVPPRLVAAPVSRSAPGMCGPLLLIGLVGLLLLIGIGVGGWLWYKSNSEPGTQSNNQNTGNRNPANQNNNRAIPVPTPDRSNSNQGNNNSNPVVEFTGPEDSLNRPGYDYTSLEMPEASPRDCQNACAKDYKCKAYTYVKPGVQGPSARCWLKDRVPNTLPSDCCISGVRIVR